MPPLAFSSPDFDLSRNKVNYPWTISFPRPAALCNFVRTGDPNKAAQLPTWIASDKNQKRVLIMGEKPTHMGKPSIMKMIKTMLTNKAVGE